MNFPAHKPSTKQMTSEDHPLYQVVTSSKYLLATQRRVAPILQHDEPLQPDTTKTYRSAQLKDQI